MLREEPRALEHQRGSNKCCGGWCQRRLPRDDSQPSRHSPGEEREEGIQDCGQRCFLQDGEDLRGRVTSMRQERQIGQSTESLVWSKFISLRWGIRNVWTSERWVQILLLER